MQHKWYMKVLQVDLNSTANPRGGGGTIHPTASSLLCMRVLYKKKGCGCQVHTCKSLAWALGQELFT